MCNQSNSTSSRSLFLLPAILLLSALPAGAKPPAIQITHPNTTSAEELSITINPVNPQVLAVGANLSFHFRSNDGGTTWTENHLSSTMGVAGDPCVIFDANGDLYYSHLSNPAGGSWLDRIVVQKSTDGGLTWNDGVGVGHNPPKDQDKSWLAADRTTSFYRDNLYLAWTEFDTYGSSSSADSTRILFSRSLDHGLTWSDPLRISDRGGNCIDEDETVEGAVPAIGPDGQVYMAWSGHDQIWFDSSLDGGATFGQDIVITTQPGGWDFAIPGVWRANGMPITACDVSSSNYRGRIYVVFSDQRNGTDDTDVFLSYSDNQGASWSSPSRVNDDTGASQQFFPWMTVDPMTGAVSVVFYDRRNTNGDATEVTLAVSRDGGSTFTNMTVSDAPFTPWDTVFFGDYIGIDSWDGITYATWMSMDQGDLSVWAVKLDAPSGVDSHAAPETRLVMSVPAATSSSRIRIRFTTFDDGPVKLSIFDVRGRRVRSLVTESRSAGQYTEMWDGADNSGRVVSSGMYIVRLEVGRDVVTRKVVIAR